MPLYNEGLSQASVSALDTMTIVERRSITQALKPQEFKDGAVLIKQGEPRDAFFIIVQGQISCTQRRTAHRWKVGPAPRRALFCAPQRASSTSAPRHSPGMSGRPRCSTRQGCASRHETKSATKGPWPCASRVPPRAPGASR